MFGGEFGAFRSRHRHFFDEDGPVYKDLATILAIRNEKIALRRGRQYLCPISGDGEHFGEPHMVGGEMRSVVPWMRLFDDQEMLLAINTDDDNAGKVWVMVKRGIKEFCDHLRCIYSTDHEQIGRMVSIEEKEVDSETIKVVFLEVPAAGFVIYEGCPA
jgi:hypothetical protein